MRTIPVYLILQIGYCLFFMEYLFCNDIVIYKSDTDIRLDYKIVFYLSIYIYPHILKSNSHNALTNPSSFQVYLFRYIQSLSFHIFSTTILYQLTTLSCWDPWNSFLPGFSSSPLAYLQVFLHTAVRWFLWKHKFYHVSSQLKA